MNLFTTSELETMSQAEKPSKVPKKYTNRLIVYIINTLYWFDIISRGYIRYREVVCSLHYKHIHV